LWVEEGDRHRVRCIDLEIHFGKPVVARVRKCRTVVVRNKRQNDEKK